MKLKKKATKMVLVVSETGHCLVCGKDCLGPDADTSQAAMCYCAECKPAIGKDTIYISIKGPAQGLGDCDVVELHPGLKVRFTKPAVFDERGNPVSREGLPEVATGT